MNGETVIPLYYYDDENIIVDEDNDIIHDIFRIMTPSQLMLSKQKRGTWYIPDRENKDIIYELMFPIENEEDENAYYYLV